MNNVANKSMPNDLLSFNVSLANAITQLLLYTRLFGIFKVISNDPPQKKRKTIPTVNLYFLCAAIFICAPFIFVFKAAVCPRLPKSQLQLHANSTKQRTCFPYTRILYIHILNSDGAFFFIHLYYYVYHFIERLDKHRPEKEMYRHSAEFSGSFYMGKMSYINKIF